MADSNIAQPINNLRETSSARKDKTSVRNIPDKLQFGIHATYSYISTSIFGLGLSFSLGRWGGYLTAMSNFKFTQPNYNCDSAGKIEGGGYFWGNGNEKTCLNTITAGPSFRINQLIRVFVGCGYAVKDCYWQDTEGKWAKVTDLSSSGIAAELGIGFTIQGLTMSAAGRYLSCNSSFGPVIAIGYEF